MEKADVIAIRDALMQNGNKAIRVIFDNGINLSLASDVVIWDDSTDIVVGIIADYDSGAYSAGMPVKIICSNYENIQFITSNASLKDIQKQVEALETIVTFTEENKKSLNNLLKLMDPRALLSHKAYEAVDIIRD